MAKRLISVETILETALQQLDEKGVQAISARNLAASLRCSTRTLYQQVGKRDELVSKLFAHHFSKLQLEFDLKENWQQTSYAWALALRNALIAHPHLSRLLTPDHREPIAAYSTELLRFLLHTEFPKELALRTCRVLVNTCISLTLSELATPVDYPQRKRRSDKEILFEDLIVTRAKSGAKETTPKVFSDTLNWIIQGIEQELANPLNR